MTARKKKNSSGPDFRPASYWKHENPLTAILANISGQARRRMITDYWICGNFTALNEELLKDDLPVKVRRDLSRIHPFFMGGEYLPGRLPDEVTIVRINLQSTTYDVIELRARRLPGGKIALRWVDEYDTEFIQPVQAIDQPFSFGELIDFITKSGPAKSSWGLFPLIYNVLNNEDLYDAESLREFTTFDSDYYPDLISWCATEVDKWIQRETPPPEDEDVFEDEAGELEAGKGGAA